MRLSSIKLAGFKSFIDPTQIEIDAQLVGIVGPNGCGKSNIIDAMRWVLGESRASELRGESMQDVIFNGSSERKPGNRASVELLFDNSQGRIGGQWAQYTELSVKRVLTRDGTSSYYINNLPVRRRDVYDIFLGTGLGPRAYAIIGQGMISRIIESKPDELRVFFEEAAGVSKYKDRRRETENRLKDTRENLQRVEDITEELSRQLEKLEAQAQIAREFSELQNKAEQQQQLLWLLRKNEALIEQQKHQQAITQAQLELEKHLAQLRAAESELEHLRVQYQMFSDELQVSQNELYEINVEVSRLEAQIQFARESEQRLVNQLHTLKEQSSHWQMHVEQAQTLQSQLLLQQASAEEKCLLAEERLSEHEVLLPAQEQAFQALQAQLNQQQRDVLKLEQDIQVKKAQSQHFETQIQQYKQRQARLLQERAQLPEQQDEPLNVLKHALEEVQAQYQTAQKAVLEVDEQLNALNQQREKCFEDMQQTSQHYQCLEARWVALTQLQSRVQSKEDMQAWLLKQQLDKANSLWKHIHIDSGWETAVEAVLRERVFALEVDDFSKIDLWLADPPPLKCAVYRSVHRLEEKSKLHADLVPLLNYVQTKDLAVHTVLADWLHHVYVAQSLEQALAFAQHLPLGAICVLPTGDIVTPSGIQFYAQEEEQSGMLARQTEIESLNKEVRAQQLILEQSQLAYQQVEQKYAQQQKHLAEQRQLLAQISEQVHETEKNYLKQCQAKAFALERHQQIEDELSELAHLTEEMQLQKTALETYFEEKNVSLEEMTAQLDTLTDKKIEQEAILQELKKTERELDQARQEARYAEQYLQNQLSECDSKIVWAQQELRRIEQVLEEVEQTLSETKAQHQDIDLDSILVKRVGKEELLRSARARLDELSSVLRQKDESRLLAERAVLPFNEKINALQLKEQAARIAFEQFSEQLSQSECDEANLQTLLAPELKASVLQAEVARLNQQIAGLGAVNMAALEELETAQARKTFLDAQFNDLTDALTTLEDAIRKIDQETREVLQNTFDQVNHHFGLLFPRLFGGGTAKLMMLGEEILDAGVQITAQPPGKKNTTIHLLSGGEKALTAIALVFAMFELNPAPFCLLDEVDAPLDDANTERFAKLVKAMSDKTQFVFISHNKISMEVAHQLIGVTMQEEGVSRVVAVDIQSASDYAQATDR